MKRFDPVTHTYWLDDVRVPSVSEVLKFRTADRFRFVRNIDAYRNRGTAVHAATQALEMGLAYDGPDVTGYLDGWIRWLLHNDPTWDDLETFEISERLKYGGTRDRCGRRRGRRVIVDIKAGVKTPDHGPQTAAYDLLDSDDGWTVEQARDRVVVYLPGDGTYREVPCTSVRDYVTFLNKLTAYHRSTGAAVEA